MTGKNECGTCRANGIDSADPGHTLKRTRESRTAVRSLTPSLQSQNRKAEKSKRNPSSDFEFDIGTKRSRRSRLPVSELPKFVQPDLSLQLCYFNARPRPFCRAGEINILAANACMREKWDELLVL